MLILGLDPGSRHTGWAVLAVSGSRLRPVGQGRWSPSATLSLPPRLAFLVENLQEVLSRFELATAVVESPYHGLNTRSLIVLAQARGALLAEIARHRIEVVEYSPAEVKVAVAGHGRASKEQVARMVGLQLGLDTGALQADTTDALAVAICGARRYRMDRLSVFERGRK
jgi:crossover junction endodeoxyribonuclease RuvC